MDGGEKLLSALSTLACPVSQAPGQGGESYCVYKLVEGRYTGYASNEPTRTQHIAQVHIYSKSDAGVHRTLMSAAIVLLRGARIRVFAWGPDDYEAETNTHHIAITVVWADKN